MKFVINHFVIHLDFSHPTFNGLSSSEVNRYRDYWKQTFRWLQR